MTDDRLLMHALADDELSGEQKASAEKHLADCPQCRAEFESVVALKSVLNDRLEPVDVLDSWKRCSKRLDEIDRSKRVEGFVTRHAWSLCSIFLVVILAAAGLNRTMGRNSVGAGDVAQMASGLLPMSTPSTQNPVEMQRWVSDKVGDVPMNLQARNVQVLGGAARTFQGHRMLRLTMRDEVGEFALLVISNAEAVDGFERMDAGHDYEVGKIGNVNCVAWTDRGNALLVVGNRPISDLCVIAESISVR